MGTKINKQKPSNNTSISVTNSAFTSGTGSQASQSITTNIISINSISTKNRSRRSSSLANTFLLMNKVNNSNNVNIDHNFNNNNNNNNNRTGVIYRFAKEIENDLMRNNDCEENREKKGHRTRLNSVRFAEDTTTFFFLRKSVDDQKLSLTEKPEEQSELQIYKNKAAIFPPSKIFKLIRTTKNQ